MRVLFQICLCLYDKYSYTEAIMEMLEYYYELWTAALASGFNRDGAWINGIQHPWYQNAGQYLVYSWPPGSKSVGFGDGSEKRDEPGRQRVAFADFLAREIGDRYAGWYAGQCEGLVRQDVDMRLYRMVMPEKYVISLPSDAPKLKCYKDIGEVNMHSDLEYIKNNISFRLNSVIYKGTIKYFV